MRTDRYQYRTQPTIILTSADRLLPSKQEPQYRTIGPKHRKIKNSKPNPPRTSRAQK
ncbi:MAG: hypothetical protein JGK17_11125 [Microcoleus sp. PH2017_10_PVI_O_A]|uniref:hypothetical protein n=1 Tax=unclassified Microcoleus TaxID=2642155 RepID=UPI001D405771|nr:MULTISPECIES: hypothetical protein [unclassified Microcoleus]MCC3406123.1 hypothetical protein [Microcoleus sp. PH2017_10_PVI_O_A]MCC3460531.1 hypothetical protein [Microcoleus sp. PH2017_11_PCY_U_A]MCC3479024.1 hypothetical protein [Microcoleus sp. PH2017_12_PCY_D_A]MCC3529419.1 hypothetical protein [Microcoleus sp. PH2017_21_RUC_O_A]MCC3541294.1 hypothetical protein [Microcoleus sp. PH2017_22_RUC_O_B]